MRVGWAGWVLCNIPVIIPATVRNYRELCAGLSHALQWPPFLLAVFALPVVAFGFSQHQCESLLRITALLTSKACWDCKCLVPVLAKKQHAVLARGLVHEMWSSLPSLRLSLAQYLVLRSRDMALNRRGLRRRRWYGFRIRGFDFSMRNALCG